MNRLLNPTWRSSGCYNYIGAILFFFSVKFTGHHSYAQAFAGSGTFESTTERSNREKVSANGSFQIYVDDCKWRIRTTRADESLDYVEAGGENKDEIFFLASHTNDTALAAKELSGSHPTVELEVAFGQIISGNVPHFAAAEPISILWLAYASGCYFQSKTNTHLDPIFWFGGQYFFNKGLTLPASWELGPTVPLLPRKVVYFNDGYVRGLNKALVPVIIRQPEPYQDGFTNAVYEASMFVQVGAAQIPSEFSLTIYRPMPTGKVAGDLLMSRKFSFRLHECSELAEALSYKPTVPGLTSVKDYRLAKDNGTSQFSYNITNEWPAIGEVAKNPRLISTSLRTLATSAQPGHQEATRYFVRGVLAVSFVILLVIVIKQTKKKGMPC